MENILNQRIIKALDSLKEREKEIIILRFGLHGEGQKTLQAIGNQFKITRERTRQIINSSLKKIQKSLNPLLTNLSKKVEKIIKENGGLIPEHNLASKFNPRGKGLKILGTIELISRLNPNLVKIKKTKQTQNFWALKNLSTAKILKINHLLSEILEEAKKTLTSQELSQYFRQKAKDNLSPKMILSIAAGSNNLLITSQGRIGLSSWTHINPKNTRDKIYYILNEAKKPLHFTEIAQKIAEKKFATKCPTQTTVHNELISDKRFVLVGRGIYALKNWGFEAGTIKDLLEKELASNKKGLTQEELCQKILNKRIVSKNTILMNLNSHKIFFKNQQGLWRLKNKIKN